MTKRKVFLICGAGLLINVVLGAINIHRGGWWLVSVPFHLIAIGACAYAINLWRRW